MSKKTKKSSPELIAQKKELTKKRKRTKTVVVSVIAAVVIACIVVACILVSQYLDRANQIYKYVWTPVSAKNASDDEVDLSEIYNVMYSNYKGRLSFNKDGTFEFWMTPGIPEDGTHTGKFEVEDDKIIANFDEGTQTEFALTRENGYIKTILVNYEDYKVYFGESAEENTAD